MYYASVFKCQTLTLPMFAHYDDHVLVYMYLRAIIHLNRNLPCE